MEGTILLYYILLSYSMDLNFGKERKFRDGVGADVTGYIGDDDFDKDANEGRRTSGIALSSIWMIFPP
jgi:hypothetical protein